MTGVLEVHRHSTVGFALPVPAGWERTEEVEGCALVAVEPPRAEPHLRASVVVTVEVLDTEPGDWVDRSLAAVRDSLVRYRPIDDEPVALGGHPGRRVLGHYVHGQFGGVNLEQWLVAHAGLGYAISCTVAALEYDDLWDLMESVALGFQPA